MSSTLGIIDSGVGGLTVLQQIVTLMPHAHYIYCADTKHAPYGEKAKDELISLVRRTIEYLVHRNVSTIVFACNTISGAVFTEIQKEYPHITYIQMIQHGLQGLTHYHAHAIGVLATHATVQEGAYVQSLSQYFPHAHIQALPAPQLVLWAEQGITGGKEIEEYIYSLYQQFTIKLDMLILACTHFPYFMESFLAVLPKYISIYNPSYAVAHCVASHYRTSIQEKESKKKNIPHIEWYITGEKSSVQLLATQLGLR